MATIIKAGNATDGLALTADNTGILQIKTGTGSGTTALTIDASQNATFAGTLASGAITSTGAISGTTGSFSGNMSFNSGYGSAAVAYGCRAWVNFNGTGTVAIRASGNVSSITDGGVGVYTVNFTTAMPDANYSFSTCGAREPASALVTYAANTGVAAGSLLINTASNAFAATDFATVTVSIFR